MLSRQEVVLKVKESGLVAIVRTQNSEQAFCVADACIEGGVAAVEVTFTVPGAQVVIEKLARKYSSGEIIIGAGTVLDPETARIAILSGAQYIVSPHLNVDTIKLCNRYQIVSMPGAMSLKEVIECMEAGADFIKIFPGELFGPKIVKAIRGPLPYAPLMPTGGVSIDNVGEWIKAGAMAVGVGSNLTAGAKNGDYVSITTLAKQFIEKIKEARKEAEESFV